MKKGAKLNIAFKGSGRLSPNSKQKHHESACCFENEASTALRKTRSCSRDWTSREARQEEEGGAHQPSAISHNRLGLASIGNMVPCRKWGGWSGAGGDFEKGVYGLQLSSQQPAASALAI
jgi:hypothetical protein